MNSSIFEVMTGDVAEEGSSEECMTMWILAEDTVAVSQRKQKM
jgi:hypothetical protein